MECMADPIREKLKELGKQHAPDADRLRADVAIIRQRDPEIGERFAGAVELLLILWPMFTFFTTTKRRMNRLFSFVSEKARKIFPGGGVTIPGTDDAPGTADPISGTNPGEPDPPSAAPTKPPRLKSATERRERMGGKKRYPGAETVVHEHPDLTCGQRCPECDRGNLYDFKAASYLRLLGRALFDLKEHKYKKLRCSGCQHVFSQTVPPEMKAHSDESARSIAAIFKYAGGMPFNRMQMLTGNFGIEVPKSTVFDMVEKVADAVAPVHEALVDTAAAADLLIADDTTARILDLEAHHEEGERKGLFTTGIVAKSEGGPTIHLYFTGPRHTGDNLGTLLERRDPELPTPIQMSDALSRNFPEGLNTFVGKCLGHARRKFVDCHEAFPEPCAHMIREIGEIYLNDLHCREQGFDWRRRLAWHVEHSKPIMDRLLAHAERQLEEHLAEPNGELGKAYQYLLNHQPGLTLFLEMPGCPLDSNEVERALKVAIRNRTNAYFFKSQHGATIGDILMSVIKTASVAGVNPHEYLIEIQKHKSLVFRNPAAWLPWNYRDTLNGLAVEPEAEVTADDDPVEEVSFESDLADAAC